ncbi:MAG: hypothetical protein WKF84_02740 [Pyrinomonadaceae bacterium]
MPVAVGVLFFWVRENGSQGNSSRQRYHPFCDMNLLSRLPTVRLFGKTSGATYIQLGQTKPSTSGGIMRIRNTARLLLGLALLFCFGAYAIADTIRLKDGTVVRGEIVGFKEQQFTVLLGASDRGRRSRMMIYMEDIDSIEFDPSMGATTTTTAANDVGSTTTSTQSNIPTTTAPSSSERTADNRPPVQNSPPAAASGSPFFQVNVRVRADSTTNGWTNSGLVVRKGQRLRINSSGRVSLGQGRFATPAGIATLADKGKLMQNEPTGALIAVIGDDNDEFILVGGRREFPATRDGVLFFGVNEGELNDNTGNFDVTIEAETATRATR